MISKYRENVWLVVSIDHDIFIIYLNEGGALCGMFSLNNILLLSNGPNSRLHTEKNNNTCIHSLDQNQV